MGDIEEFRLDLHEAPGRLRRDLASAQLGHTLSQYFKSLGTRYARGQAYRGLYAAASLAVPQGGATPFHETVYAKKAIVYGGMLALRGLELTQLPKNVIDLIDTESFERAIKAPLTPPGASVVRPKPAVLWAAHTGVVFAADLQELAEEWATGALEVEPDATDDIQRFTEGVGLMVHAATVALGPQQLERFSIARSKLVTPSEQSS